MSDEEEKEFEYPFLANAITDICEPDICPSVSPSVDPNKYCGGSLVNSDTQCPACSFEDDGSDIKFLGCDVVGFSGKLGFNGSESSVSIELVAAGKETVCETNCTPPNLDCPPESSDEPNTYIGSIGHVYTFNIGSFCFRGILSYHQYVESSSGYRYRVTLTDGRQILSNVAVLMQDSYSAVPDQMYPNLINILYNLESSVGDDNCGSGDKCRDFGQSGKSSKGILLKRVLEGIDGKPCQLPISKAFLNINLCELIKVVPDEYRISQTESNVLELVTLACEEAGYDFYVTIVGYDIKVFPINNKSIAYDTAAGDPPLFTFLNELSKTNYIIDREYGQELTFNKSKKMVIGDNLRYIIQVEPSQEPCMINSPGSVFQSESRNASAAPDNCDTTP